VDAHCLPLAANSLDNIIGLDVLHHFQYPLHFMNEVARVLRPAGRLVLVEPWITPFSRFVYTYLHQEGCDLDLQPWRVDRVAFEGPKRAFDGNAAIPFLLITRGRSALEAEIPCLQLVRSEPFSLLTYLLSLGFKRASLLPRILYSPLVWLEDVTHPLWKRAAALRVLLIWEKREAE
jgi:SAM-dependent methyltransferase